MKRRSIQGQKMSFNVWSKLRQMPVRGVLTVFGGFLFHCTTSTGYIFGNMNPYLTSYLRARSQSTNTSYSETVWISTSNYMALTAFWPILTLFEQKIPPRYVTLAGGLIFNTGLALTYFAMKHSMGLTALTYGVINGLGKAMSYSPAVKGALLWFPKRAGLVTGVILCGVGFGTFVFNQAITQFVNPENLSPDIEVDKEDLYFSQDAVLDRLPFSFLMLGGVYTAIQLFAVFGLMFAPPERKKYEETVTKTNDHDLPTVTAITEVKSDVNVTDSKRNDSIEEKPEDEDVNLTPLQVLRTKEFYVTWIMYAGVVMGIFYVMNFYKTFAQTFIEDDHFLALAGSVGSAANALGRPTWGAVGDKLGYTETLVIIFAIFGTASFTFNLCEYGGKPMLMMWVILLYGTFSGFYIIMPSLTFKKWGKKYYSTNYGLITTSTVITQLIATLLTTQLKSAIGWRGVLYIGAGGILFSFVLALGMLVHFRLCLRRERMLNKKIASQALDTGK